MDEAGFPIRSAVDSQGRAVINGIKGPRFVGLDLSLRYRIPFKERVGLDLSWDVYNVFNHRNENPATGNRSSSLFMVPTSGLFPRQMQLGARFTF